MCIHSNVKLSTSVNKNEQFKNSQHYLKRIVIITPFDKSCAISKVSLHFIDYLQEKFKNEIKIEIIRIVNDFTNRKTLEPISNKYEKQIIKMIRRNSFSDYLNVANYLNSQNDSHIFLHHSFHDYGGTFGCYLVCFLNQITNNHKIISLMSGVYHESLCVEKQIILNEIYNLSHKVIVSNKSIQKMNNVYYGIQNLKNKVITIPYFDLLLTHQYLSENYLKIHNNNNNNNSNEQLKNNLIHVLIETNLQNENNDNMIMMVSMINSIRLQLKQKIKILIIDHSNQLKLDTNSQIQYNKNFKQLSKYVNNDLEIHNYHHEYTIHKIIEIVNQINIAIFLPHSNTNIIY
jgi:hypothetical protein